MAYYEKYEDYFEIDPEYFPAVNQAVIKKNPEMWKKYYPHQTFVKLINTVVSVLTRKQKRSIWIEGAYGTGKSHAALTLKKLLDASQEETREYFEKYELDNDLYNRFAAIKNQGKILTVHRYGSSNIHSDNQLIFAIQESIQEALKQNGCLNSCNETFKEAFLQWLEDDDYKNLFNSKITSEYSYLFNGETADDIINKLKNGSIDSVVTMMNKVCDVAEKIGINVFNLTAKKLNEWITNVIKANQLTAITFIWDEFTEYFINNSKRLTGFQEIAELSETVPFYLIIVTHESASLFNDKDKDKAKILNRFVEPTCKIELPENMAIQLIGAAMEKVNDVQIQSDWNEQSEELYDSTTEVRKLIAKSAKIDEEELRKILPIHPYTALLLKHISTVYDSNQRSMFDFIKNDRGEDIKGFQWFIKNYGPQSDNPLLTADMLWDYFYEKGKDYLSRDVKSILDCYSRATTNSLNSKEQQVLKAVLLMQAISQRAHDSVELFIANEKNLNLCFEGTDFNKTEASRCADKLVREEILYRRPLGKDLYQYSALINSNDMQAIEENKKKLEKKDTNQLLDEGQFLDIVSLPDALKLRFEMKNVSLNNITSEAKNIRDHYYNKRYRIPVLMAFAKDEQESVAISKKIFEIMSDDSFKLIIIDASITPLGVDGFEQYCKNMAESMYQCHKEDSLATQYRNNAIDELTKWKNKIKNGEFNIYSTSFREGKRAPSIKALIDILWDIDRAMYPCSLELNCNVISTMYDNKNLPLGVECGAKQEVSHAYKAPSEDKKIEKLLGAAWKTNSKYWQDNPGLVISKMKKAVDDVITEEFKCQGRVSIAKIYDVLSDAPYGFMPCNLTAFIIGFLLKEYVDGTYNWTDNIVNGPLTIAKLKEMVSEIIKCNLVTDHRYKDKYIVAMTDEEKAFNQITSIIFNIPMEQCSSIEHVRDLVRCKMKGYNFPIWTLANILNESSVQTSITVLSDIINDYCGIANSENIAGNRTVNDIAREIGLLYKNNETAAADLKLLFTKESCERGMNAYLHRYQAGKLIELANTIQDGNKYLNILKHKFDADAANWVWNKDTVNGKIDEVILEYSIILESNKILAQNVEYDQTIEAWRRFACNIRVPYVYLKNYLSEFEPFMLLLYGIAKENKLALSKKKDFLNEMSLHGSRFYQYVTTEGIIKEFKNTSPLIMENLTDENIRDLFHLIPTGMFTKEKSEYISLVEKKTNEFKSSLGRLKLQKLWQDKTCTSTPKEWSDKHKMPILCMVEENELSVARQAFSTINNKNSDNRDIEDAIKYLNTTKIFDDLSNPDKRDEKFRNILLDNYALMLPNIVDIKEYLYTHITTEPYAWLEDVNVKNKIKQLAELNYNKGGYEKALAKIDDMDIADLKRYLQNLIKDNMLVGMEIIRNIH